MKRYKVLIFDFDGTLAATEVSIQFCMKTAFEECGLVPPAEEDVRKAIGIPLQDMIAKLGNLSMDRSEVVTNVYRKYYKTVGLEMTKLFPNAFETVQSLSSQDYKIVILSNKNHEVINMSVEKTGLMPFCSVVSGDKGGKLQKPNVEPFFEDIAPKLNVLPADCLMIGDAVQDTTFAQNCNMDAVWASYGFGILDECINNNVKFIINNITELTDILS